MTVLAAFKSHGMPILVGDMVVSRDGVRTNYYKKAYWVSPNFVIGWTGDMLPAKIVIKEIFEKFYGTQVTREALETHLATYKWDEFGSLFIKLVGWVIEDEPHCFLWNSGCPSEVFYDDSYIEGSGEKYFEKLLQPSDKIGFGEGLTDEAKAILEVLGKASTAIFEEVIYAPTWDETFGFGYDIYYYYEGSFQWVEEVLHIWWDYHWDEKTKKGTANLNPLFHKYIQAGELSFIQFASTEDDEKLKGKTVFCKPIYDTPSALKPPPEFSIPSQYYANHFYIHRDGKDIQKLVYVFHSEKTDPLFSIQEENGVPTIVFKQSILDRIITEKMGL